MPRPQTLHLSSWSPADFADVAQFEQIECPQRSNLGIFWRVSKSPLQHRHNESRSSAFKSGSKNGIENEAEDDMDGDLTDSGMGRLLRRKTDVRRLKQMLGDCGGRRVGGEGNVRWVGV